MSHSESADDAATGDLTVDQIMQTDVLTASPDEPLSQVAQLLWEAKISCVCVVEAGKLVGIVTEADFIRCSVWFLRRSG